MLAGLLCGVILGFVFFLNLVLDFLAIALVLHYYLLLFRCCIIAVSLWYWYCSSIVLLFNIIV